MTELAYPLPEIGEPSIAADPRTLTALTNIKTWSAGQIDSTNLKAGSVEATSLKNEAVTEPKLSPAVAALLNAKTSGLIYKGYTGPATLVSGEFAVQGKSGETFTLPTATTNRVVGVFCGGGATTCKVTAAGASKIYGGFTVGAATITLTEYGYVELVADGTNWLIKAGAPRRETVYTEARTSRTAGVEYEVSASRPALVTVVPTGAISLFVTGAELLAGETVGSYTFELDPDQKWVYTSSGATVRSSYKIL